ncbi:MAG: UPF0158 family protein [Bacteroidetes bacterium]|nr:UPF0158 family protein [Bacteroidota bacterium]MBU2584521.1 UPF0158 family protein [Bacteroidota bacterium]
MKSGEKVELTEEQIKSIAGDLECGMKVYVNIETREIKSIINLDESIYADEEVWKEDIKEIEENFEKYLEFEKMDSSESFQVMEEFVESVRDEELRKKLELGLSLSKPFRNFKDIIDDEGKYRAKWFAFKSAKYIDYVKEQLDNYNKTQ